LFSLFKMADVKQPVVDEEKERQLALYRRKLSDYREVETKLKDLRKKVCPACSYTLTFNLFQEQEMQKEHDKSENDIKSLQSVGQIVGEVLKQLTDEKFIVKATNGPRYVVGCRRSINRELLKQV
jgi:26S proteasome regulatory subunit T4